MHGTQKMSYRISATKNNRSYDIDDCNDDVATIDLAREWADDAIGGLTIREQIGLSVWIDQITDSGAVQCVETVFVST